MAKFAFNSSFYREGEENFHSITCENREQLSYLTSNVENLSASFYTNSDSILSEKLGLNLWIKMK